MGSLTPETYRYEKKFGTYYLMDGENIIHAGDVIAIAFAIDAERNVVRHKHGPADSVKRWVEKARAQWQQAGLADTAGELVVIESDRWNVEDLNKIIHNSTYIVAFLEREKIDVVQLTAASRGQQSGSSSDNLTHDGDSKSWQQ